jgi:hypothetical protein
MSALRLAETEWTEWRGDFTGPGIMARIEDSGRTMGFWIGPGRYGHSGERIQCYVKGANGRTVMAPELQPADVRRLAASLLAMADRAEAAA